MTIHNARFTKNPVKYLTRYSVSMALGKATPGGIGNWVIEYDGPAEPATLRPAVSGDADTFKAYYLPYADNQSYRMTLGDAAKIMITPPLTGCSFVIQNKWYTPMVSHHNRQGDDGLIDQADVNDAITAMHGKARSGMSITANYYAVRKADYVPAGEDAQDNRLYVFGVRTAGGWTMYRMKHDPLNCRVIEAPSRIN